MVKLIRRLCAHAIVLVAITSGGASANAASWAEKMFAETAHNFRIVGRGTAAEYRFEFTNLYEETVHVSAVRTSCGCTTPTLTSDTLRTHETAAVVASLNTASFIGAKSATITVVFDQPTYAEVRLQVSGHIRTDITFDPPEVSFGVLSPGETSEQEVVVTHRGNQDWRIRDVRSHCDDLSVRLTEPEITPGAPNLAPMVRYRLQVRNKESLPEGEIQERLTLISNDARYPSTEMSVTGKVRPLLSVSPASIPLGRLAAGEVKEVKLVVRGEEPFEIRDIVCTDRRFTFEIPSGSKKLHLVEMRFSADHTAPISHRIRVQSDLPDDRSAMFLVTGSVAD